MSNTGRVHAAVETVPLGNGRGTGTLYRDIKSIQTNKSVSQPGSGNFSVTLALPHGAGILVDATDNDLVRVYARRGGAATDGYGEPLMVGQIDRISRTGRPDYVEWTLRGKCLTKQFLTNVIYMSQYGAVTQEDGSVVTGVLAPTEQTIGSVAASIFGCKELTKISLSDGQEIVGVSLQCFLEKLVTEPIWVDADLLSGYDINAEHLILDASVNPSFLTVGQLLDQLADRPYVYWYVDESGMFHFKPWHWRDGTPTISVDDQEYLNDNTSVADFKVIAGCAVKVREAYNYGFAGWALSYNHAIGQRYGSRYSRVSDVPYLYNFAMAQRRAVDHIQIQYLGRIESQVTVRGSEKWRIDRNVHVPRLGGYFYLDSVQHRLSFAEQESDWTTTLGLTHGRAYPESFLTVENGDATIRADINAGNDRANRAGTLLNPINNIPSEVRDG